MSPSPSQALSMVLGAFLFLAMSVVYSSATWCVCKDGLTDTVLQKTLDYACGSGADCNPITPTGACYNPSSVKYHCSYAVNSYFQKRSQAAGTCDFSGTAAVTSSNPSISGCSFPASASGSTTTSPVGTVPSTSPTTTSPVSGTPTTSSPYTTTVPGTGTGTGSATPSGSTPSSTYPSGIGSGVAPTGVGMNEDNQATTLSARIITLCWVLVASVMLPWN